jgi:hypothetical protein
VDCPHEGNGTRGRRPRRCNIPLSIYLNGLGHLYQEQAQQLKQQIDKAERVEQRVELERIKTTMAEVARHNLEQDYIREREHTLLANKALWDEVKERRR